MKIRKRGVALMLVFATVLMLGIGSLAYFTDRTAGSVSATAGTLELDLKNLKASKTADLKPGYGTAITYSLDNIGSKSADVRESIVITVKDANGNALALNTTTPEFALYEASAVKLDSNGKATITGSPVSTVSGNQIKYKASEFILNGDTSKAGYETETGGMDKKSGSLVLVFAPTAGNAFQNVSLTLEYLAEAKQHRNTNSNTWNAIDAVEAGFTFGGSSSIQVVPEK